MNTKTQTAPTMRHFAPEGRGPGNTAPSRYERNFFLGMACLFPVLAVLGFGPSYHAAHIGELKLHWFTQVHGGIMGSWLLVFLIQSVLAAKGQLRYHRQLGLGSVGLGVLVWITMGATLVRALLAFPPSLENDMWDIVSLSIGLIALFGVFLTAGIAQRKNSASHKRLLLLATVVLMQAAIDRIRWLPGLGAAFYVRFLYLDALLLLPLLAYDLISLRRIHKTTLLAGGLLVAVQVALTLSAGSPAVHRFWFNRLAPFVEPVVEIKLTDAQTEPLLGNSGWEKWHMTVSRVDGKLFLKLPDLEPFEIAPKSETEFFMKRMLWTVSFPKDAEGRVLKLVNREPGKTWEAPKM
jgi:hypothetical protein